MPQHLTEQTGSRFGFLKPSIKITTNKVRFVMYQKNLYPTPKSVIENGSERFVFGASVQVSVSGLQSDCVKRIKYLWNRFSCTASELNVTPAADGFRFVIGDASAELADGDSYAIQAGQSGVCVVGRDSASLMDGIKTLMQLICPDVLTEGQESLYITAAVIHDSPALPFRAIHICLFGGTKLWEIEKAIHLAGFMKMTHVILEFWGTFPYACIPSWKDRTFNREDLRVLVELVKSYGMEVVPMINHLGHAPQSRGRNGRHVVLDANPRLERLFEPDGWTWCVSNPDTYKLLAEMRAEMTEFCGEGKYFHLGFDEADSFATCDRCRTREPHELLAEYVNRLTDDLCKAGRRPIMWHDMLIRRTDFPEGCYMEANGHFHNTDRAIDLIDRRILMADWNYAYRDGYNPTTSYFIGKGFDTVICPWDNRENIRSISLDAAKYGAFGLIMTTWHHLPNFLNAASYWGNCAWSAGQNAFGASGSENAAFLRRLYNADGYFDRSGWSNCEVEF